MYAIRGLGPLRDCYIENKTLYVQNIWDAAYVPYKINISTGGKVTDVANTTPRTPYLTWEITTSSGLTISGYETGKVNVTKRVDGSEILHFCFHKVSRNLPL